MCRVFGNNEKHITVLYICKNTSFHEKIFEDHNIRNEAIPLGMCHHSMRLERGNIRNEAIPLDMCHHSMMLERGKKLKKKELKFGLDSHL